MFQCSYAIGFFFFKQKTAYEMRISDWSSDVCSSDLEYIVTNVTFDVNAQRRDPSGARNVVLPYFAVVIQGSDNVVSKSVSRVSLDFAEGQYRASSTGAATGQVLRAAATLPQDIQRELTRAREIGRASCRDRVCRSV